MRIPENHKFKKVPATALIFGASMFVDSKISLRGTPPSETGSRKAPIN